MFSRLVEFPENPEAARHGQQVQHFLSNQDAFRKEFIAIRNGVQNLENDNEIRKKNEAFQLKIQGIHSSCEFLNQLGHQIKDEHLKNFAVAGSALTQIYSSGSQVLANIGSMSLAALNPIAMVGMGALTLFNLFGNKKKVKQDNEMAVLIKKMQAIIREDMYDLFAANFANQKLLLNTVIAGFDYLERVLIANSQRFEAKAVQYFDQIEAALRYISKILTNGQQTIALQSFHTLIKKSENLLDGRTDQNIKDKCQKNACRLSDWIELKGRSSLPLHTGADWVPEVMDANYYPAIDNAFKGLSPDLVSNMLGFLAKYAHYHLGVNFADTEENTRWLLEGVMNSLLWIEACEQFIALKHQFGNHLPDPENKIQNIIQAAENQIQFIQALRTTPRLFEALFEQYQAGIQTLEELVTSVISEQNDILALKINIFEDFDKIVAPFGKSIASKTIGPLALDGSLYQEFTKITKRGKSTITLNFKDSQLPFTSTDATGFDLNHKDIAPTLAPFLLLERLGLGTVSLGYRATLPNASSPAWLISVEVHGAITGKGTVVLFTLQRVVPVRDVLATLRAARASLTSLGAGLPFTIIRSPLTDNWYTTAISESQSFFITQRKVAIQKINAEIYNETIAKINANLQLIKAYCLAAGFQNTEREALWNPGQTTSGLLDGQQIAYELQEYVQNATIDTPQPSFQRTQFRTVQETIVSKVRSPNTGYIFADNTHIEHITALMNNLQLLAQINTLSSLPEMQAAKQKEIEAKAVATHKDIYRQGMSAGDEIAPAHFSRILRDNNFPKAAELIGAEHPNFEYRISDDVNPIWVDGLLQGFTCKGSELALMLIENKKVKAGSWLLNYSSTMGKQLALAKPNEVVKCLVAPPQPNQLNTTAQTQQGTGITMFDNSKQKPALIRVIALCEKAIVQTNDLSYANFNRP